MLERIHSREQIYTLFNEFSQEDNWFWWVEGAFPNFLKFEDWVRSAESDPLGVFLHSYKSSKGSYNLLGFSKFYMTNLLHGFSYLMIWVLPSLRKQRGLIPYGFIVVSESIDFAFYNFPIRKIYFHILKDNLISLNPVQKVAQIEGTMKDHYFLNGEYRDVVILSITRSYWHNFYAKYKRKVEQYF